MTLLSANWRMIEALLLFRLPLHRERISSLICSNSSSVPIAARRPSFSTITWSARRRAARRCETTRQVRSRRRKSLPQLLLSLHVQGARQIVEYQQLRVAHEHARRGATLHLPAGEAHATRPDQRIQTMRQPGYVILQHTQADGGVQVSLVLGRPSRMFSRTVSLKRRGDCGV